MIRFEYYLEKGDVKKVKIDKMLAISIKDNLLKRAEIVLKYDLKDSLVIFENLYDCLREICDALLALDGYKSYSHQASIAYLAKFGFDDMFLEILDKYRYKRNASKYYGKNINEEDAKEIKEFYLKNMEKLIKVLNHKIKEGK